MTRSLPRHAWTIGLGLGPLSAYMLWALQRHRMGHLAAATALNIALWIYGPAFAAANLWRVL